MDIKELLLAVPGSDPTHVSAYLEHLTATGRLTQPEGYSERHHILPRSLFPQFACFTENPWNSVYLTAGDHFISHYHLAQAVGGKMWTAVMLMASGANLPVDMLSAPEYQIVREKAAVYHSGRLKDIYADPVLSKAWHANRVAGYTPEARKRMSEKAKVSVNLRFQDQKERDKISASSKLRASTPEAKAELSERAKTLHEGRWWWDTLNATERSKSTWAIAGEAYDLYVEFGNRCVKIYQELAKKYDFVSKSSIQNMVNKFEGRYDRGHVNRGPFRPYETPEWIEFVKNRE